VHGPQPHFPGMCPVHLDHDWDGLGISGGPAQPLLDKNKKKLTLNQNPQYLAMVTNIVEIGREGNKSFLVAEDGRKFPKIPTEFNMRLAPAIS